ncbi:hypothetical protein AB0878_10370 [Amycolatopsis sp. NPDC047767]|uniref:hypothetical protein n=1 Tax=Amycolatopsis sp. NPDC047767 TaxID=3156765 RepID=UPI0034514DB5
MKRRILLTLTAAAVFTALGAGVADADPAVWALPGVDLGGVLGPVGQPVALLAPAFGLITIVS